LLTPLTPPALAKLTPMLLLIEPAAEVLTLTVMVPLAAVLLEPASTPFNAPTPLMRASPAVPKLALRSSTNPLAPVAVLRITRFCETS
jgi:hypothetical protein